MTIDEVKEGLDNVTKFSFLTNMNFPRSPVSESFFFKKRKHFAEFVLYVLKGYKRLGDQCKIKPMCLYKLKGAK